MGEFMADYGLFFLKSLTVFVALAALIILVLGNLRGLISDARSREPTGLQVSRLNDGYEEMTHVLQRALLDRPAFKRIAKEARKKRKLADKGKAVESSERRRLFVLDFKGDINASQVGSLRHEISAVLSLATPADEVVLRLENAGGTVHEHGLAASQLLRFKARKIPLTILVDKIAASGGYLMACAADRLIAAPFAIVGSIGVVAQMPNFNRALSEHGIDFEQITAGKYKRTLTVFGKNTDEDRAKLKEDLDEIHDQFKSVIAEQRPELDIERVSTGEHWYGKRALELGLIDELGSSDDYILAALENADLYHVRYRGRQGLQQRARAAVRATVEELAASLGFGSAL